MSVARRGSGDAAGPIHYAKNPATNTAASIRVRATMNEGLLIILGIRPCGGPGLRSTGGSRSDMSTSLLKYQLVDPTAHTIHVLLLLEKRGFEALGQLGVPLRMGE